MTKTDPRLLGPEELAEIGAKNYAHQPIQPVEIDNLLDHASAQQETLAAQEERIQELEREVDTVFRANVCLLELFALVPHDDSCPTQAPVAKRLRGPCNCIKSKVTI